MLGTQRPTKIAWLGFPVKNSTSEYTKDKNADTKSSLSVSVNFLIIICVNISLTHLAFQDTPRFF